MNTETTRAAITAAIDAGASTITSDPVVLAMLGIGTHPGVAPITNRVSRLGTLWWEVAIDGRRAYIAPLSNGGVLIEPVRSAAGSA